MRYFPSADEIYASGSDLAEQMEAKERELQVLRSHMKVRENLQEELDDFRSYTTLLEDFVKYISVYKLKN